MTTLLLRLQGPMQSWGTMSRFNERDTQLVPSKSGVLGLVCAALGRDRSEPVGDLAALSMGVRIDQAGVPMRDFQTAIEIILANEKSKLANKKSKLGSETSNRYYLSDAAFLVALEGDHALLERIHNALRQPIWPLALGRKSYVPSMPVYMRDGLQEIPLVDALRQWRLLTDTTAPDQPTRLDVELEDKDAEQVEEAKSAISSVRFDQPVAPFSMRQFGPRFVKTFSLNLTLPSGGDHVSNPSIP